MRRAKLGDRYFDDHNGYWIVCVRGHPLFPGKSWVNEHRKLLAEKLCRPLKRHEIAHHINEIKTDNRPKNIELKTRATHAKAHGTGRRHSQETREKMSEIGRVRNLDPGHNRMIRERVKAQHRAGKFGSKTWKNGHPATRQRYPGRA